MTVEELFAKKISDEIDVEILKSLLKGAGAPKKEIEHRVNILRNSLDDSLERELLGGKNKIHGTEDK